MELIERVMQSPQLIAASGFLLAGVVFTLIVGVSTESRWLGESPWTVAALVAAIVCVLGAAWVLIP